MSPADASSDQPTSMPTPTPADGGGALVVVEPAAPALPASLEALVPRALAYAEARHAENTRRGYGVGWRAYERWCATHGCAPVPATPAQLALCLTDWADAGRKVATLSHRLAAVVDGHRARGHVLDLKDPGFQKVWAGIRRTRGEPPLRKAPILVPALRLLAEAQPDDPAGDRDRALLVVGFASFWRRSELSGLVWRDVEEVEAGLVLHLPRSKTDQEGAGAETAVPYGSNPRTCPVRTLAAWRRRLIEAGADVGPETPVFRPITRHGRIQPAALMGDAIGRLVQRALARALERLEADARRVDADLDATPVDRQHAWDRVQQLVQLDPARLEAWRTAFRAYTREKESAKRERGWMREETNRACRRLRNASRGREADALRQSRKAELPPLPRPPKLPASRVAGHSLRAGGITAAVLAEKPLPRVRQHSRHASDAFYAYVRVAERFKGNVVDGIGL